MNLSKTMKITVAAVYTADVPAGISDRPEFLPAGATWPVMSRVIYEVCSSRYGGTGDAVCSGCVVLTSDVRDHLENGGSTNQLGSVPRRENEGWHCTMCGERGDRL